MHENQSLASHNVTKAMQQACAAGKWMAAVWKVQDGRLTLVDVTTYRFPVGDFLAAVSQLTSALDHLEDRGGLLPFDPLPQANLDGPACCDVQEQSKLLRVLDKIILDPTGNQQAEENELC